MGTSLPTKSKGRRLSPARTGIASPNPGLDDLVDDPGDYASSLDFASGFFGVTDVELGSDASLYVVDILNDNVFAISSAAPPLDTDGGVGPVLFESPADGVGNACDNRVNVANPRVLASFLANNPWATLTGGQRDDDHDGYGNVCDADFTPTGSLVGTADLTQLRASNAKSRALDICGTTRTQPCARFDLDEAGALVGTSDLTRFRALNGKAAGPRCAVCTGTNSVLLPCTAGTAGSCN